jgi:prepilin-type N-terminal cleavage/methylation domain-containing protein
MQLHRSRSDRSTVVPHGFSLIELLVVIGIIAILIGILLPVMARVRDAGKATVCLSNMRQLALATTGYYNDNDRYLPQPAEDGDIAAPGGSTTSAAARRLQGEAVWFNALDFYLQQTAKDYQRGDVAERNYAQFKQDPVYFDRPDTVQTSGGSQAMQDDDVRTLKMNEYFGYITSTTNGATGAGTYRFFKVTAIPLPSDTLLYGDGRSFDTTSIPDGDVDVAGSRLFAMHEAYAGLRHDDGANLLKADMSATHQTNPIDITAAGYRGWYDDDDPDPDLRPDITFNFDNR